MRCLLRKCWLWCCLALLAVAAVFTFPPSRLWVVGWVKGESFYQRWPTSYWIHELHQWNDTTDASTIPAFGEPLFKRSWSREAGAWEKWLSQFIGTPPPERNLSIVEGDPQAVPVLTEMLADPNWRIRWIAAESLCRIGPPAKPAFPTLLAMVQPGKVPPDGRWYRDESMSVDEMKFYYHAALALHSIDFEAAQRAEVRLPLGLNWMW